MHTILATRRLPGGQRKKSGATVGIVRGYAAINSLFLVALRLDDARLSVFLKLLPAGMRAPPAIRVATCVHDPSGFFLKASQGKSARPAGYELMV